MTTFEDRERAFEAKYAHDEEFRFRVIARRDKLFAHWTAEQLHLDQDGESKLTAAILKLQDGVGHDQRVLERAAQAASTHAMRPQPREWASALERCAEVARHQLLQTRPAPL